MQVKKILRATTIQELQAIGCFLEVKHSLESELKVKLGVTGWKTLFDKITHLKNAVSKNKSTLLANCKNGTFIETKRKVAEVLQVELKARGWLELEQKIQNIVNVFCSNTFDPFAFYEKNKLLNFKYSSKLEGIEIETSNKKRTLKSVLAKYQR